MSALDKNSAERLITALIDDGYAPDPRNPDRAHMNFSRGRGDNVWIRANTYNIVRCNKGTRAEEIITGMYGAPKPEYVSESQQHSHLGWGFNGYQLHKKGVK